MSTYGEVFQYLCIASNVSDVSVLVPGAGLGRLAYEIARLGYVCQGNEFSLFMLFASNFILNKSVLISRVYPILVKHTVFVLLLATYN